MMIEEKSLDKPNVFLEPSRVRVTRAPGIISTVVASSVAVCMWDRKNHYGGMCHFVFPEMRDKGKTTTKYGNVAIYAMLKIMQEFGSEKEDIEVQLFGGAEPKDKDDDMVSYGPENIASAHRVITKQGLKITSEDTGGHVGRKVAFDTETNEIIVYKVEKVRQSDWYFK